MKLRSEHERIVSWPRLVAVLFCAAVALLACGCARQTSLTEVGASGVEVWVQLTTSGGEAVTGTLVSLDASAVVLETSHRLGDDVRVRERGDETGLYSGTDRVPGEVDRVESDETGRTAFVHRTFRALEIDSATFHEGKGQRSLSSIISHILGPAIGGTLALIL